MSKAPKQVSKSEKKKIDQANLASIKRIDPFAEEVLTGCVHTALFNFNVAEKKWVKGEVDGPLFVYRRKDKPWFSFMIANRLSLDDHIEPILKEIQLKYEPPYIFIYDKDNTIRGLWFSGEDECKRVYNLFTIIRKNIDKMHIPELIARIKAESNGDAAPADEREYEGPGVEKVQKSLEGTQLALEKLGINRSSDPEEEPIAEKSTVIVVKEEIAGTTPSSAVPVVKVRPATTATGKAATAPAGSISTPNEVSGEAPVVGLSREQLLQSVLYLLQNDSSFLDRIHQGYFESLRAHLGSGGKK